MTNAVLSRQHADHPSAAARCHPAPRPRRWAGLDGLRALAVVAVVTFHFAPGVLPGGFLGVDIFFVLSGYLITRMIVEEYLRIERFRFGRFYGRRARRLLPAVATLLIAVLAASAFWRDQLATVRASVLAAATYVNNWWQIYAHQSYFTSAGRPNMLQHLWSLAVEEQFYLLWPMLAVTILRASGGAAFPARSARRLAGVAAALAGASTAWMAFLAVTTDVPYGADGSRLYYGTDTHGMGLLLGAAVGSLAAARVLHQPGPPHGRAVWLTDLLGAAALCSVVAILVLAGQFDVWLYRGGYLAVAAITGCCIAAVTRSGSRVGHAMDRRPVRWLAERSYAIYLWHWPIAMVSRPGVDIHAPVLLIQMGRVLVTLVLAELSYRLVEAPIRRDGFGVAARRGRASLLRALTGRGPVGARSATAAVATIILVAAAVMTTAPSAPVPAAQRSLGSGGGRHLHLGPVRHLPPDLARSAGTPPPAPVGAGRPAIATPPAPQPTARTSAAPATSSHPQPPGAPPALYAFGDSVMLGARNALGRLFPHGSMDAVEGRQPGPILKDVRAMAARGTLPNLVVIGVGDNGLIDPADLRSTLAELRSHQVIVINNRVGMPWESPNNATITAVSTHFANVRVLDWHAVSAGHASWFYDDGIHLTPTGAQAYAELIARLAR